MFNYMKENNMSNEETCNDIISCLIDIKFLNRIMFDKIIDSIKLFYCENVFASYNIIKNIDYNGGTLNYQGIELLQVIEREFFCSGKKFNCILLSKSTII